MFDKDQVRFINNLVAYYQSLKATDSFTDQELKLLDDLKQSLINIENYQWGATTI
jgi:hypothetical protein